MNNFHMSVVTAKLNSHNVMSAFNVGLHMNNATKVYLKVIFILNKFFF